MTDPIRRATPIRPTVQRATILAPRRGRMELSIDRRQWMGQVGRAVLAAPLLPGLLAGCTTPDARPTLDSQDRLVELDSGRDLTRAELMRLMVGCRFLLLGELHDNTWHHRRRAELLRELAGRARPAVVAEHLTRGRQPASQGDLLSALQAAGFDPQGWQWPLHQPLFAAGRDASLPLQGGNLPAELARRIAREGSGAVPTDLAELLARSPLDESARSSLDQDLREGHCGHLPESRLPSMRLAQRARDAAMAQALLSVDGRPAVLLAGNGHVRQDWGVGQILQALQPQDSCVSVLFGERGSDDAETIRDSRGAATHLWLTAAVHRENPCATMPVMRRPESPSREQAR